MWRSYLVVAFRNLRRNRIYTLINILGLAIGIASFVLIALYIWDESSYDQYHGKADRIFRIVEKIDQEGQGEESCSNPFPVGPAVASDFSDLVEQQVRFFNFQLPTATLRIEEEKYNEEQIFFADSNVFDVFDFPLDQGNPETVLNAPNTIVISRELATKYFGNKDAIGQFIRLEGDVTLTVTGIFGDIPAQSHFQIQGLISFSTLRKYMGANLKNNWIWNPCWTYLLMKENAKPELLEQQFPAFIQKYYPEFIRPQITHYLQPLTSIHLNSHLDYEIERNGNESDVFIFAIIGIFILLVASINFMSLATARSANRAREVGMRKVLGSSRGRLIQQFLGESVIMCLLAVLLALCLIEVFLPLFNNLAGKELELHNFYHPIFFVGLLVLSIVVGIASGFYPAFYLSSFDAISVLRGGGKPGKGSEYFRKMLVVLQFAISAILIISTLIIYGQFNYLRDVDLGFNDELVVVLPAKNPIPVRFKAFRDGLLSHPEIVNVTSMNEVFGERHNTYEYSYEGREPGNWVYFPCMLVDESFVETFEIELVAGRNFSEEMKTDDSLAILINETMVKRLNWGTPEEALGKRFHTPDGREVVVGVMKDFNFVSLQDPIAPFALNIPSKRTKPFFTKFVAVRISGENIPQALASIEEEWLKVAPDNPFDYTFLDERLDNLYQSQDDLGRLVANFSLLAIFIACLGLFALVSFTSEKRRKEIGIRKVLGASTSKLVMLLVKDFLKLVLLANVIAWPVAYFLMNDWLERFAYHIGIGWTAFVFTTIGIALIALLTVVFQASKAALANPADSLRNE